MSDEATASNYLASTLANPDPADALVEARRRGGNPMSPEEEAAYRASVREQNDPTLVGSRAWHEAQVARDPQTHLYSGREEPLRIRPGEDPEDYIRRRATMGGQTPMGMPPVISSDIPEAGLTVEEPPPLSEVLGDPASGGVPPAPPSLRDEIPEDIPPSTRTAIRAVRAPDGRIVFTNVGVGEEGAPGGENISYREAVKGFREKARAHQAGLPPAEGRITAAGIPIPGRHFLVDVDAPLPGDVGAPGVSQPFMADPTAPVSDEDWAAMSPGAREEFVRQAEAVAGARESQAAGVTAEHEARMATDPEYRAEHRTYLYRYYVTEAQQNAGVQASVDADMATWQQQFPNFGPDSPEFRAARQEMLRTHVSRYLKEKYADVAPWDDVLSQNIGLTL